MRDRRTVRQVGRRSRSGSARTWARCSARWPTAGPTPRASRSTASRRRAGSTKLSLFSEDPRRGLGGARRRRGARQPRGRGARGRGRGGRGAVRAEHPHLRVDERGHADRDLQGDGRPARVRRALRARRRCPARTGSATRGWRPRARSRPRARTRSRPGSTSASSTTARSRTTTGCAARLRREGIALPDRERHRGRGRLPRVAAARGRRRCRRRSRLPRRPRRLLHVRGRHRRRLRRAARPDRLQAGRDGRDRRLGRDGVGVPRDRRAARRRRAPRCGSPSRRTCTRGSEATAKRRRWRGLWPRQVASDDGRRGRRDRRPRGHPAARAQRAGCTQPDPAPRWRVDASRTARTPSRSGIDAEIEVDVDGHVGYYCAGMNKRATVRVHGNAGVGLAENIMSGHRRGRRLRGPVVRGDRARRRWWSCAATRRRAAGSR